MSAAPPLLEVQHLTMRFGGLVAIDDLSFTAAQREITAIIGPNGAGKTTVFNCLTGFYKPTVGQLTFHGDGAILLLEQMEGFRIARAGVARTFQNIRLFGQMSVLENLVVAQHNSLMRASGYTVLGVLGVASYRHAEEAAVQRARDWLGRIGLLVLGFLSGFSLFGLFQSQQQLILGQALGAATEAVTLHRLDDLLQPLGPRPLSQEHGLEQIRIVGESLRRAGHRTQ